jgi:hypothetical protein
MMQNWDGPEWPNEPLGPCIYYLDNLLYTAKPPVPSIAVQPVSQQLFTGIGTNAFYSVVAAGQAPLAYQWYKGTTPLSDGTNASGSIYTGSLRCRQL